MHIERRAVAVTAAIWEIPVNIPVEENGSDFSELI